MVALRTENWVFRNLGLGDTRLQGFNVYSTLLSRASPRYRVRLKIVAT